MVNRYLEEFQRSSRRPAHSFVNDWDEIANLTCSRHVYLSGAVEGLFRRIEVLEEYHDRLWRRIRLGKLELRWVTRWRWKKIITFERSGITSRYNRRSVCLAAILFRINSTAKTHQLQNKGINVYYELNDGSFSGMWVSGLTVLFCRLTNTHSRIWFSG